MPSPGQRRVRLSGPNGRRKVRAGGDEKRFDSANVFYMLIHGNQRPNRRNGLESFTS